MVDAPSDRERRRDANCRPDHDDPRYCREHHRTIIQCIAALRGALRAAQDRTPDALVERNRLLATDVGTLTDALSRANGLLRRCRQTVLMKRTSYGESVGYGDHYDLTDEVDKHLEDYPPPSRSATPPLRSNTGASS